MPEAAKAAAKAAANKVEAKAADKAVQQHAGTPVQFKPADVTTDMTNSATSRTIEKDNVAKTPQTTSSNKATDNLLFF